MSSAPCAWADLGEPLVEARRAAATTPMLPGAASVMTQAISVAVARRTRPRRGDVVVRQHDRVGGRRAGDAGRVGQPSVATPEPAAASSASTCPW
jgi:hypothetical protein